MRTTLQIGNRIDIGSIDVEYARPAQPQKPLAWPRADGLARFAARAG
jgi:hypothetical protein